MTPARNIACDLVNLASQITDLADHLKGRDNEARLQLPLEKEEMIGLLSSPPPGGALPLIWAEMAAKAIHSNAKGRVIG